jgi:hypothetical protein
MHSTPSHPVCLSSILMSFYVRGGLPSAVFPPGFAAETLYACWFASMQATCPAHHIRQIVVSKFQMGKQSILN